MEIVSSILDEKKKKKKFATIPLRVQVYTSVSHFHQFAKKGWLLLADMPTQ